MTEYQIKAIAEEYARPFCGDEAYFDKGYMEIPARDAYDSACAIIKWLCEKYCIVEREKVMEAYKDYTHLSKTLPRAIERNNADVAAKVIADLFCTSIFNQNEE